MTGPSENEKLLAPPNLRGPIGLLLPLAIHEGSIWESEHRDRPWMVNLRLGQGAGVGLSFARGRNGVWPCIVHERWGYNDLFRAYPDLQNNHPINLNLHVRDVRFDSLWKSEWR